MSKRKIISNHWIGAIILDILLVSISFLIFIWIKPASKAYYLPHYITPFFIFLLSWLIISVLIEKYKLKDAKKPKDAIVPIFISNFTVLAVIISLVYFYDVFHYSRLIVFGTILSSTFLEIIVAYAYYSYRKPVNIPEFEELSVKEKLQSFVKIEAPDERDQEYLKRKKEIEAIISEQAGENVLKFISSHINLGDPKNLILSTTTQFNIDQLPQDRFINITNLHLINDVRRINKFFESINEKLPPGGYYINSAETFKLRKEKIYKKYMPVLNRMIYFGDFILNRVLPKLPISKKLYFVVTLGRNRVLSRAETLGRLYSCGFDIIDEQFIENKLFFVARKVRKPFYDLQPTYGPLIRLKRIGKNGQEIGVYKFRTMHAFSEYLQDYIYKKYQLQEGGKFKNDFRVTGVGRIMRKFWLDELPMFINLIKGEMKLVGVRPLSKHYFNLYSEELKQKRLKFKPGLVPPFYVDLPKTLPEIMASEEKYLDEYEKKPFRTDVKYFFIAFYNIIFKRARSN